jgi:glycosyltransferase involved in cell wall biosynthesis
MVTPATLLMPVKNGGKYLHEAMASLEKNCQPEDEILVINDGSTDETGPLLKKWSKTNPQVRIVSSPKSGLVAALNFGIRNSSNNWIIRFDVDDRYPENRTLELKKQITDGVVCIFSDYRFTTNAGFSLGVMPSAIKSDFTYLSLLTSQRTAHSAACYDKRAVLDVGGYESQDYPAEDLSLWLRLTNIGKIISVPKILLDYRLSGNSVTSNLRSESIRMKRKLISNFFVDQHVLEYNVSNTEEARQYYAKIEYGQKRYLLHLRDLLLAIEAAPKVNQRFVAILRDAIYKDPFNYVPASKLLFDTLRRKIYRSI